MLVLLAKIPFFANQTQFKSFFPHNITTTARHPSNFSHLAISEGKEIQKPSTKTFPINQLRAICLKASRYYSSTCLAVARLSWIHHGKAKRIFKGRNTKNHFGHGDGDKFASPFFFPCSAFNCRHRAIVDLAVPLSRPKRPTHGNRLSRAANINQDY